MERNKKPQTEEPSRHQEIAKGWLENESFAQWWEEQELSTNSLPEYLQKYEAEMKGKSKAMLEQDGKLSQHDIEILGGINMWNLFNGS